MASSTEWTADGSPYTVTGNLVVPSGVTLTVDTGVQVAFDAGMGMVVAGTLVAIGQSGQPVVFTLASASPSAGNWQGIVLAGASPAVFDGSGNDVSGTTLQYVDVEYGGDYAGQGIGISGCNPYLDNVLVDNTVNWGILIQGGAAPVMDNTIVQHSTGNGIGSYSSNPVVENSTAQNNGGYGMYMQFGSGRRDDRHVPEQQQHGLLPGWLRFGRAHR